MWSVLQVCSDDVAYGRDKRSRKKLKFEVEEHIYPPAFCFLLNYTSAPDCSRGVKMNILTIKGTKMYDFPPDCSRGAMKTKLSIEGTNKGRISFPIKVYEVKSKWLSFAVFQPYNAD